MTENDTVGRSLKILILATVSGGYAGADSVGQMHSEYSPDAYILPVRCPGMFPEDFYLRSFAHGIDGIIVMYSGTDCPFRDCPDRTAELINSTYGLMKERGIDSRRLRLTAICTVCGKPFLKEVREMRALLDEIGPAERSTEVTAA
jgi:F420-non-reducing hydrogenase iron-sulfur subunit